MTEGTHDPTHDEPTNDPTHDTTHHFIHLRSFKVCGTDKTKLFFTCLDRNATTQQASPYPDEP